MAAKECCAMGMSLASIETKAEQDCILNHNKSNSKRHNLLELKLIALSRCNEVERNLILDVSYVEGV